jgi:hypothetical protein
MISMANEDGQFGKVTADDVRRMLSNPVDAYGTNLVPAERVAAAVMQLNVQLAQEMRDTGTAFTLVGLDRRFQSTTAGT